MFLGYDIFIMQYLKIFIGVFLVLAASRFIPHPPNFTSLIALSFYIPALFGVPFVSLVIVAFVITDLVIGMHSIVFFTWGSIVIIGIISKYFIKKTTTRISGVMLSVCIFFIISNFGVWVLGSYEYSFKGLLECYIAAIPFFGNTIISTLIFSTLIEIIFSIYKNNKYLLSRAK